MNVMQVCGGGVQVCLALKQACSHAVQAGIGVVQVCKNVRQICLGVVQVISEAADVRRLKLKLKNHIQHGSSFVSV